MDRTLEDEVERIVASMENGQNNQEAHDVPGTTEQETPPNETIHIHYFPDAIVILKEGEETTKQREDNAIETTLAQAKQPPVFIAYAIGLFYLFLPFFCIAFQVYEILNPPIATVTITPKSQQITLNPTLQLGRLLHSITISQSQTTPTTGIGHQDARSARGYITFYNGLFTSQTIPSGTIFSGPNGVQVITDQDATIPAASPPNLGQTSIPAHAVQTGEKGDIPALAINTPCCLTAVKAVNSTPFTGGQDERDFQTVTNLDIDTTAMQLKPSLAQSTSGALQRQLKFNEQLYLFPCTPTVTSDHQPGQEATVVKITVSETCSAVTYKQDSLTAKVTQLLTHQARQQLGTGYNLIGSVQVSVKQATATNAPRPLVFVSFQAHGTWVYGLAYKAQQHIKQLIAGKPRQEALHLILALPGIMKAAIEWDENTKLPKSLTDIHFHIIVHSS
jgi:hypothetical protein